MESGDLFSTGSATGDRDDIAGLAPADLPLHPPPTSPLNGAPTPARTPSGRDLPIPVEPDLLAERLARRISALRGDRLSATLGAGEISGCSMAGCGAKGQACVSAECGLVMPTDPAPALRQAAVLVPIIARGGRPTILLTQRTAHLTAHGGQISFPGGRVEPTDVDDVDTALRETEEEVGLPRNRVRVIGRLDTYITRTGFAVVPVVGWIQPPMPLVPDPEEVAEVFEVPLAFFLEPGMPQRHSRDDNGTARSFFAFPYGERYIWGATAGMLVNLRHVLLDA